MNSNLLPEIKSLLGLSLQELFLLKKNPFKDTTFNFYHQVLISYFSGDNVTIYKEIQKAKIGTHENNFDMSAALWLAETRLKLLQKSDLLKMQLLNPPKDLQFWPQYWLGEFWTVQARWHDLREENEKASTLYLTAADEYRNSHIYRKELRCRFNHLICLDRLNSGLSYHKAYYDLAIQSRKLNEYSLMTMIYVALSQKMLDLGAYRLALKFVNKALKRSKFDIGSSDYFKAKLQRAFVYYLMNDLIRANSDIDEARISHHEEIKATIKYLDNVIEDRNNGSISRLIFAGIYERINLKNLNLSPLSYLEEKIILLLLMKPRTRQDLANRLWAPEIPFESRDLRLKSLLKSLKNKAPSTIKYFQKYYHLITLESRVNNV